MGCPFRNNNAPNPKPQVSTSARKGLAESSMIKVGFETMVYLGVWKASVAPLVQPRLFLFSFSVRCKVIVPYPASNFL